jgi:hypothetical protein
MLRIMADKKRQMESSVPMITADRKANAFYFPGKKWGTVPRKFATLYECHGLKSRIFKWQTSSLTGKKFR